MQLQTDKVLALPPVPLNFYTYLEVLLANSYNPSYPQYLVPTLGSKAHPRPSSTLYPSHLKGPIPDLVAVVCCVIKLV